jgi:hypothetical protein
MVSPSQCPVPSNRGRHSGISGVGRGGGCRGHKWRQWRETFRIDERTSVNRRFEFVRSFVVYCVAHVHTQHPPGGPDLARDKKAGVRLRLFENLDGALETPSHGGNPRIGTAKPSLTTRRNLPEPGAWEHPYRERFQYCAIQLAAEPEQRSAWALSNSARETAGCRTDVIASTSLLGVSNDGWS